MERTSRGLSATAELLVLVTCTIKSLWSTDLFVDVRARLGAAARASGDSPLTEGALQQRDA